MLQIFTMTGIIIMKIPMRWSAQILGKVYKLGQSIRVRVLDADKENATIDFVPAAIWG